MPLLPSFPDPTVPTPLPALTAPRALIPTAEPEAAGAAGLFAGLLTMLVNLSPEPRDTPVANPAKGGTQASTALASPKTAPAGSRPNVPVFGGVGAVPSSAPALPATVSVAVVAPAAAPTQGPTAPAPLPAGAAPAFPTAAATDAAAPRSPPKAVAQRHEARSAAAPAPLPAATALSPNLPTVAQPLAQIAPQSQSAPPETPPPSQGSDIIAAPPVSAPTRPDSPLATAPATPESLATAQAQPPASAPMLPAEADTPHAEAAPANTDTDTNAKTVPLRTETAPHPLSVTAEPPVRTAPSVTPPPSVSPPRREAAAAPTAPVTLTDPQTPPAPIAPAVRASEPPPVGSAASAPAEQLAPVLVTIAHAPNGAEHVTLQLQPDALGQLRIQIDRTPDSPIQVRIEAERPETLTLLQRDTPQLQRALDQAGVPRDSMTVSFHAAPIVAPTPTAQDAGQSSTQFMGTGTPSQGFADRGPQRPAIALGETTDTQSTPEPVVRPSYVRSGLDITA